MIIDFHDFAPWLFGINKYPVPSTPTSICPCYAVALRSLGPLGNQRELAENRRGSLETIYRTSPILKENNLLVWANPHAGSLLVDISNQPFGIGENIVAESKHDTFWTGLYFFDVGAPTERLDRYDLQ